MNSQTANMAMKRMNFKDILVAHGMRSNASTVLNKKGFQSDVIEAALAHTDTMRSEELITAFSILINEEI